MPRDYPEYEDESTEETYRDPLKPFLIALVVLLLLFAAIIVLLYMRLQTANTRAETLSQELTAVQVQLDDLRAQRAAETPTPTPTKAPTPTPEPTPEPTATPEPTPEPTPPRRRQRPPRRSTPPIRPCRLLPRRRLRWLPRRRIIPRSPIPISNKDLHKNPLSALCRERIFFYDGQRRERRRSCSYSLLSGTITVAK